ncbi:uncharacterized protein LOC106072964 isoform X2 [Biomphalaria glabrata]|uniref:Uncharacterized protein LOC106072964 isoform X2 n=1 Tax=Biomphalaria glabrata TaxID=6526 RepID=A0A9W2YBD7_BIOGL|nr:uncharacterized protein LOC106072964 isoform X2 [Biomphalaria glabrata]XP_055860076.1 uncharacterized protein LOC106072964 isoform X2 [Biomphalaria glabrata]
MFGKYLLVIFVLLVLHYLAADESIATPDTSCKLKEERCVSTKDCCDNEENECRFSNHPGGNFSFCVSRNCTHINDECRKSNECCKFKDLLVTCRMTNDRHIHKCLYPSKIQMGIKPKSDSSSAKMYEQIKTQGIHVKPTSAH